MSSDVLVVHELKKRYPGKSTSDAVAGISFGLRRGEILGLLGPNGAGKTTTIQMLLGTLLPTSGSISYFGQDLATRRSEILARVGYGSAYNSLVWRLTVQENLEVFGRLSGLRDRRRERITELLARFGMLEHRKKPMSALSAGQRTRVVLCKAFLHSPEIVLLDEPTASLDPDVAHEVRRFVREERSVRGVAMVYTSHNMQEVSEICDEVLFLSHGKILARDTPTRLAASIANTRVRFEVDVISTELRSLLAKHVTESTIDGNRVELWVEASSVEELIRALLALPVKVSALQIERPSLEDYFVHHAQRESRSRAP